MDKSSDRESKSGPKSGQLCCVPRCNNRGSGHIWPKTPVRAKAWEHVVKRKWDVSPLKLKNGKVFRPKVCSAHFRLDDYRETNVYGEKKLC